MNRRNMIGGVLGLCGLGATAKGETTAPVKTVRLVRLDGIGIEHVVTHGPCCPNSVVTGVRLQHADGGLKLIVEHSELQYADCEPATK